MALVWVLLGILVLGGVAVVAAGRGEGLPPPEPDRPDLALPPDRPLERSDVDQVRFSVGLRGYRMDEVDDVLDRLALDLEARDERIAVLEQVAGAVAAQPEAQPGPVPEPEPEPEAEPEAEPEQQAQAEPAAEHPDGDQAGTTDEDLEVGRTMIVPFQQTDGRLGPPAGHDDHPPGAAGA